MTAAARCASGNCANGDVNDLAHRVQCHGVMTRDNDPAPPETIELHQIHATGGNCGPGAVIVGSLLGAALGKSKFAVGAGATLGCMFFGD